jgi:hypothetical protein
MQWESCVVVSSSSPFVLNRRRERSRAREFCTILQRHNSFLKSLLRAEAMDALAASVFVNPWAAGFLAPHFRSPYSERTRNELSKNVAGDSETWPTSDTG